jgi:hypothetical protein
MDGLVAGTVVEGSMTKAMFMEFLEFTVVCVVKICFIMLILIIIQLPKCTAYPGPLSVLIMDNAKIHHGEEILELVDRFGKAIAWCWHCLLTLCQVFASSTFHPILQISIPSKKRSRK